MGKDLGEDGKKKPSEVVWHAEAPEGKLDLLVTLDFRMSTTCMYSDIVLPTATWYEKNDLNTSDMHPFIHPLTAAVDPVWESRNDWDIYKGIAKAFSEVAPEVLGVEKDVVLTPIMHDTAGEIAQPFDVKDWKKGEIDPIPGKTMPAVTVVERDYPNLYKRFTSLGPLMAKLGNGGKGMSWNTEHEVDLLKRLNGVVTEEGASKGLARIDSDIDACEVILSLAPETNGEVAVKAWASLERLHRARPHPPRHPEGRREDPLPRCRRAAAQDHLLADLVGAGIGEGLLQRRLHQRARTDPVAHADRPSAALSGSSVDARLRRGLLRLSSADRHQDGQADDRPQAERQCIDRAQLHHAAPEMGHPLHLHRQPADADAVARRPDRVDQRDRRQEGRHRRQRLDRGVQHQRRAGRARGGLAARQAGHVPDVSCAGEDRERAGLRDDRPARRHPQLGDPHRAQADAHDRRLRPAILRLQLLRHGRLQPRRIRHRAQDVEGRLARHADRRSTRHPCAMEAAE